MNIYKALRENNLRITNGERWLVIDENFQFIVYERTYMKKNSTVLYSGTNEDVACEFLVDGDELKCPPCPQ